VRQKVVLVLAAALVAVPLGSVSAKAADTTPPRIKAAVALDANGDDHVDGFRLTYTEPVHHTLDTNASEPFAIAGYTVTRVLAAVSAERRGRRVVLGTDNHR
jgi:hypothetical protein